MKDIQANPIGVFDSGVGGLTVLRELKRQLPNESILYFADTARLPYGTRSAAEILQFVREILHWMASRKVKMAIMACNTSSALALEIVRQEFDFPILGIILPGARAAARSGRRIGVIATPATATSHAYRQAILEANPDLCVWEMGCPEFVPLIESNRLHEPETVGVARQYLQPLLERQIDTLIYGCTHYPHLEPVLRQILPPRVRCIDPARWLVRAAERELELMGLKHFGAATATGFCTSGCPEQFATLSQQWLGTIPIVERISLAKVPSC